MEINLKGLNYKDVLPSRIFFNLVDDLQFLYYVIFIRVYMSSLYFFEIYIVKRREIPSVEQLVLYTFRRFIWL